MVEEDCFIGGDVVIMPNVIIGRECVVEPGTVVSSVSLQRGSFELGLIHIDHFQNVQPGKVVAGNPMRIIRDVVPVPTQDDEYGRVEPAMLANMWPGERSYNRDVRMGM